MTYIKKYVLKKSNTLKITHVKKNFHITSIVKPDGLIFLQEYNKHAENISYVSLGAVLRQGDSCLLLLEREAEVAFARDKAGIFVELDD